MYYLRVESTFRAAHNLRGYKGKCEELHGHNWKVEVTVTGETLDKAGMLMDFKVIKSCLNKVLDILDHKYFNRIPYFKKVNPTSENIARYIFDKLKIKLSALKSVTVWENATCAATYEK